MVLLGLFFLAFILIPLIDYFWLAKIMSAFYLNELGPLARTENGAFSPILWPAAAVYLLLALGILFFVIPHAEGISDSLWRGGLLGLVVYGVYDMTNLSLIQGYSLKMSLVDMAWGTVLCGVVSGIVMFAKVRFGS